LLRFIICIFIGHTFQTIKEYDSSTRHVVCIRCQRHYGQNDGVGKVRRWTEKLHEAHEEVFNR